MFLHEIRKKLIQVTLYLFKTVNMDFFFILVNGVAFIG
ncbi:hypothetical protein bcere0026_22790 [Bacillus mycoides]|uniref:Uncharacterized protein n=1 Tax=Bacillus mycoides TaxID=1405 RepID=C2XUA8_BACMY|nr:hypothetical protein bcere0026_22790 [Bacillus mycoides]